MLSKSEAKVLLLVILLLICFLILGFTYKIDNTANIICTTPLVTIYDIDKTKAKFHLTCTDEQGNIVVNETLKGVQVGYIAHKENKRVLGMKGRSME